ncbi:hypothetical protein BGZ63DRAFT_11375 [Mariannaea sp. PMI_226]|nr:hypothetical protein BGZ63DRAFT_11375 [Mariannaea sp. PMI_226]
MSRYGESRRPWTSSRREYSSRHSDNRDRSPDRRPRSPRNSSYHRRSSDFREQDDVTRQTHSSPSHGSMSVSSNPMQLDQSSDHGLNIKPASSEDSAAIIITNLICEKTYWYQSKKDAESKLGKLQAVEARAGTRHQEFATTSTMFQYQIKQAEDDLIKCNQQINSLDAKLSAEFGRLAPTHPLSMLSGDMVATRAQPPRESPTDPELQEVRDRLSSDFNAFKTQYDHRLDSTEKVLRQELHEMTEKHKRLEERFDQLQAKHDGSFHALGLRITVLNQTMEEASKTKNQLPEEPGQKENDNDGNGNQSDKTGVTRDQLESALNEAMSRQYDEYVKNSVTQVQLCSVLEEVRSCREELSKKISFLEEQTRKHPVLQELSAKVLSFDKLPERISLLEKYFESLPSPEEFENKAVAVNLMSDRLSNLEQTFRKSPIQKLSAELPGIERLLKNMPMLEELYSMAPGFEQLLSKAAALEKEMSQIPRLEGLSAKYTEMEDRLSNIPDLQLLQARISLIEEASTNLSNLQKVDGMRARIDILEERTSNLATVQELSGMRTEVDEVSKTISSLQQQIPTETASIEARDERLAATSSSGVEADLRKMVKSLLQQVKKEIKTDTITDTQQRLNAIAERTGKYMDVERGERISVSEDVKKVDSRVSNLDTKIKNADLRLEEVAASVTEIKRKNRAVDDKVVDLDVKVLSLERSRDGVRRDIANCTSDLEGIRQQNYSRKREMGKLDNDLQGISQSLENNQLQLLHLNSWQSNFSTKQFYDEIVEHIASVLPNSVTDRLRMLSERVDSLESVADNALKRRKVSNGSMVMGSDI